MFPIDPTLEKGQRESLAAYKANRDHELVKARLDDVADAARGTQNLLYPMKEALRADATLGEVSDALRDVFGVYHVDNEPEPEVFPIDPTLEKGQRESLAAYKANRDHELVKARLQDIADTARGTQNLLYPMKEALRADATLGEVSDALPRRVRGVPAGSVTPRTDVAPV